MIRTRVDAPAPTEKKLGLSELKAKIEKAPPKPKKPRQTKADIKAEVTPAQTDRPPRGRPKSGRTLTSCRIDNRVLQALKSSGPGWQSKLNEILCAHFGISYSENADGR